MKGISTPPELDVGICFHAEYDPKTTRLFSPVESQNKKEQIINFNQSHHKHSSLQDSYNWSNASDSVLINQIGNVVM